MGEVRVGLSATTQPWKPLLQEHIRDHVAGVTATTVRDQHQLRGEHSYRGGDRRFDVVVVDDVMRIFDAAWVGAAQEYGTRFIGLYDELEGRGRPYLVDLGVDVVLPATATTAEILAAIARLSPDDTAGAAPAPQPPPAHAGPLRSRPPGALTVFNRASAGGLGSTELHTAVADELGRCRRSVLDIEADELCPSAAVRQRRDPDGGLARALSRVGHGHPALPDGLSPPGRDGPLGGFDAICGTNLPGGPPVINPRELVALCDEALASYEEVVVETSLLLAGSSDLGRDRFAAGRAVLARADRVVVLAGADGEGAIRLVNWLSAAKSVGVAAPVWAVFSRTRSSYEEARLEEMLSDHGVLSAFAAVHFLPEDPAVAKAKWNRDLVRHGRWLAAVRKLAADLVATQPLARSIARHPTGNGRSAYTTASEGSWV